MTGWIPAVGDRVRIGAGGRAGRLGTVVEVLPHGPWPLYVRLDGYYRKPVAFRADELAPVGPEGA